jgi:hypothetical protein
LQLEGLVSTGILLDAHYAAGMADSRTGTGSTWHRVSTKSFGHVRPCKWLLLSDIQRLLGGSGFSDIRITRDKMQRNGPRITLCAARPGAMAAAAGRSATAAAVRWRLQCRRGRSRHRCS